MSPEMSEINQSEQLGSDEPLLDQVKHELDSLIATESFLETDRADLESLYADVFGQHDEQIKLKEKIDTLLEQSRFTERQKELLEKKL